MVKEEKRYAAVPRVLIFVFKKDKLLMMKYSGKGENMNQEKADRKGIYNCIGGHIERGEDVIEAAVKEAREEAGIKLLNPKVKGIINVSGFAGKDIMNFIITGTTEDEPITESLEGNLEWIEKNMLQEINIIKDIEPILDKLLLLGDDEMLVGNANFDGKFELLEMNLKVA
jgi:8-oxo-dGTP pyrophosphatase MutT (NUDIX family)